MKTFLALICAFANIFSFAGGAYASELDFMDNEILSYEAEGQLKIALNEPLYFIDDLTEYLSTESIGGTSVDFKRLFESLLGTTFTINTAAEIAPDYLSGKIYSSVSTDAPIEFSDNLKIAVGMKQNMWVDYDLTSTENPKYTVVQTNLLNGKYQLIDLPAMLALDDSDEETNAALLDLLKSALGGAKGGSREMVTIFKNLLTGRAKITEDGNTRVIELDSDAIVDIGVDYFCDAMGTEYVTNILKKLEEIGDTDISVEKVPAAERGGIKGAIKELGLFADDALKMTYTLDENGRIKTAAAKLHLDFDIRELLKAMGATDEEIDEVFKSDNTGVDMTIECSQTYTSFEANVQMPTLTPENTIDVVQQMKELTERFDTPDYTYDYTPYVPAFFYMYHIPAEVIDAENREYYVSIDHSLSDMYDDDSFTYYIETDESGEITVTYSSDYIPKTVLKAKVGETAYTINGEEKTAKYPFKILEPFDAYYMTMASGDVLKEMFGFEIDSAVVDIRYDDAGQMETECYIYGHRPNPAYVPESEGELVKAPEIGIIGGADGPTAVFVTN